VQGRRKTVGSSFSCTVFLRKREKHGKAVARCQKEGRIAFLRPFFPDLKKSLKKSSFGEKNRGNTLVLWLSPEMLK